LWLEVIKVILRPFINKLVKENFFKLNENSKDQFMWIKNVRYCEQNNVADLSDLEAEHIRNIIDDP